MLRGGGRSLRSELSALFHDKYNKTASSSALADATGALEGFAMRGTQLQLHLRTAEFGGAIYVDLGREDGLAAKVSPERWELVGEYPVVFRRTPLCGEMPIPEEGDVEALRDLMNLEDGAFLNVVGWMVAALVPSVPQPILMLTGEQGSAKSTSGRIIIGVVDPSPAPLRSVPRDARDWATVASGSLVVGLDNLSNLSSEMSDVMCRAVTGDGFPRRRLYSDGDIIVTAFRRALLFTSIELGSLSPDLLDRALFVELQRVSPRNRRLESDIESRFRAVVPGVLGAVLTLLSAGLRYSGAAEAGPWPRMADYARLMKALDLGTGRGFLDAYLATTDRALASALESDSVAMAVNDLLQRQRTWSGTASELLAALTPDFPQRGWPRTPAALSQRILRQASVLRACGVEVAQTREGGGGTRMIHLCRVEMSPVELSGVSDGVSADDADASDDYFPGLLVPYDTAAERTVYESG